MFIKTTKDKKIIVKQEYIDIAKKTLMVSVIFWAVALSYNFLLMVIFILTCELG
jgi:hypothetical protein